MAGDRDTPIPEPVERVPTGPMSTRLQAAVASETGAAPAISANPNGEGGEGDPLIDLLHSIRTTIENGGGGSTPPPGSPAAKSAKNRAMVWGGAKALLGILGVIGSVYLGMKAAIGDNAAAIDDVGRAFDDHLDVPAHDGAADEFKAVDDRMDIMDRKVDKLDTRQTVIIDGIGDIKDELKEQRRYNRRRRRDD